MDKDVHAGIQDGPKSQPRERLLKKRPLLSRQKTVNQEQTCSYQLAKEVEQHAVDALRQLYEAWKDEYKNAHRHQGHQPPAYPPGHPVRHPVIEHQQHHTAVEGLPEIVYPVAIMMQPRQHRHRALYQHRDDQPPPQQSEGKG